MNTLKPLYDLYNKYNKELNLVYNGEAKPNKNLEKFYLLLLKKDWEKDPKLASKLINYYEKHEQTIHRSLAQIGASRLHSDTSSSDYKMQNSKEYLKRLHKDISNDTELSLEEDAFYPEMDLKEIRDKLRIEPMNTQSQTTSQIEFKRASRNVNPQVENAREFVWGSGNIITNKVNKDYLNLIPSTARDPRKAINLMTNDYEYWNQFMPKNKGTNLYKPKQGKKFYSMPNTWMFDLMYFSNFGSKKIKNEKLKYQQAIYLVGININTRFAVGRRVNGKTVGDMIEAFKDLLKKELKNKINLLIFDGEKAISSKAFEEFCKEHNINVRITYPGIHTQTAPIDRLCRTLRDYYTKMFLSKVGDPKSNANLNTEFNQYFRKKHRKEFITIQEEKDFRNKILTEALYARQMFNGEHSRLLAPIPIQYTALWNEGTLVKFIPNHISKEEIPNYLDVKQTIAFQRNDYDIDYRDELYDVIADYNEKPHHGLIKLLKEASSLFGIQLNEYDEYDEEYKIVNIDKITPNYVHNEPGIEYIIIEYCKYYNEHFVEEGEIFRIGDKVRVYDCFKRNRGSLYREPNEFLMGDWEIINKNGEIYCVYNNIDKRRLWVSKYMLSKK